MTSYLTITETVVEHSGDESDDDEDDDVVEQSPCRRWEKRRQEVMQRDVPGIDHAYLAMDTEEGVEVVWNEVQFSERKDFKSQESKKESSTTKHKHHHPLPSRVCYALIL
ncbi:nuclear receptor-binding protein-like isoform X3 [Nematostella vectensis]|uniref:nuclear receptor-binding protein-like isoform X3 n=1 Tax=Nematostella vectensis TaxID=45351 RepID=UPI00207713B6|nr:nuclear receptor-binding protein-like isoform X3 [Nematostella vectensis]